LPEDTYAHNRKTKKTFTYFDQGKKGMFEEIVLIQFWSNGAARTHCAGAEYGFSESSSQREE
jgi:hypothetical protein